MKKLLIAAAAALGLFAFAGASHAQSITWGTAHNISGNTDISVTGNYFDAITMGAAQTVNNGVGGVGGTNVTFNTGNGSNPTTDGAISVSYADGRGAYGAAFTTASPSSLSYSNLVNTGVFGENQGPTSAFNLVTIGSGTPLTIGDTYQVQAWSYYSGDTAGNLTVLTGANPVSLDETVGQYAIGTFTATATTETFNYATGNPGYHNFLNDVSVFDTTVAVPEPATLSLLGLGSGGLLFRRRRRA